MNRRSFFAQMRKIGFSKSDLQMTRRGTSYARNGMMVTIPKDHEQSFIITGSDSMNGIYVSSPKMWGSYVNPTELGMSNMLEVCLNICNGNITRAE